MNRIETYHPMFSENIFNSDFENISSIPWDFQNASGTGLITYDQVNRVQKASLKVDITSGYDLNDTLFNPLNTSLDYVFTADRTGEYIFSYEIMLESIGGWFPEVEGNVTFYKVSDNSTVKIMNFAWGNNSLPEFSFYYDKFNIYYDKISLVGGENYRFEWQINQNSIYLPGAITFYLDCFKMQFIGDRIHETPCIYTPPIY